MSTRVVNLTLKLSGEDAEQLVQNAIIDVFNQPRTPSHIAVASTIARTYFGENLKDFNAKSRGGKDRWGDKWEELKPSTIERKSARQGQFGRRAKRRREKVKKASGVDIGRSPKAFVPINVDTSRLVRSLQPTGVLGDARYRPSHEQVADVDTQTMTLGTLVPYAKYVHAKRPILMDTDKAAGFIAAGLADGLVLIFKDVR